MKSIILMLAIAIQFLRTSFANPISGLVKGTDGSSITGGIVSASRHSDSLKIRVGRTSASVAIRPDGTFQLPELVGGLYQICAQASGAVWIGSCEWGSRGATTTISADRPPTNVNILLSKGVSVVVRVDDPQQLLAAHEGKTPGAHLLMGVDTDSHFFQVATLASQDAAGRNYRMLVPFDRAVSVSVSSRFFQLSGAGGKVLPKFGNLIPVLVPSGQQPAALRLTVTGTNGQ